jgi:hypothetical protein
MGEDEARDVARELAWKHFDLHAKQRIEVFKSYLTLLAVIFAGYGVAAQAKLNRVGVAIAIFAFLICIFFWFLDRRTRDLVKLSEEYLRGEEERLSKTLDDKRILLFAESDRLSEVNKICGFKISYGCIFTAFFFLNVVLAIFACLYFFASKASGAS